MGERSALSWDPAFLELRTTPLPTLPERRRLVRERMSTSWRMPVSPSTGCSEQPAERSPTTSQDASRCGRTGRSLPIYSCPTGATDWMAATFAERFTPYLVKSGCAALRLSEITGTKREDLVLESGAHVRVIGKGRKERCTPSAKPTVAVLRTWLCEPQRGNERLLFPNAKGERLSVHGVQHLLKKYSANAARVCPSLNGKRVTVHLLRHTMALELLQAGVDRAVIALWLGHESVETTQIYLEATLAMKEQALAKTSSPSAGSLSPGRSAAELSGQLVALTK